MVVLLESGDVAKLKVCLIGNEGVGKTSLIRRFVMSEFTERYVLTVGANVHKRVVLVPSEESMHSAVLTVWDILGREEFAARYADAYLRGAGGILAVCDLSRPDTLDALAKWLELVHKNVGEVPGIVLANKRDLQEHIRISEDDLLAFCEAYRLPCLETSAKTGENVERAFGKVAEMGLRDALLRRPAPRAPRPRLAETAMS